MRLVVVGSVAGGTSVAAKARRNSETVDIRTRHDVVQAYAATRTLRVRNLDSADTFTDRYDVPVLATGVTSIVPPVPGVDLAGVFTVRTPRDAAAIHAHIDQAAPQRAVVVGAGSFGLEMAEQLTRRGLAVTVVEAQGLTFSSHRQGVAVRDREPE